VTINRSSLREASLLVLCLSLIGCGGSVRDAESGSNWKQEPSESDQWDKRVDELASGGKEAIPKLLAMFKSSANDEQRAAVEAVGKIGIASDEVIRALGDSLNNSSEQLTVRETAAHTLGKLGRPSFPVLIRALSESQTSSVANAVAEAILNMELQPADRIELILARERVETARQNESTEFTYSAIGTTTTITDIDSRGEVVRRRHYQSGPSSGPSSLGELQLRLLDPGDPLSRQLADIDSKWRTVTALLDESLAELGIADEEARLEFLAECDRAAVKFDAAAWQELRVVRGRDSGSSRIVALDFSQNGRLLASGDNEGVVRIVRGSDGIVLHVLRGHEKAVSAVGMSPRGNVVASGGDDKTVRLWNATTGESLHTFAVGSKVFGSVEAIAFDDGGDLVAAACSDDNLYFWRVADGQSVGKAVLHRGRSGAAFSLEGGYLAVVGSMGGSQETPLRVFSMTWENAAALPCECRYHTSISSPPRPLLAISSGARHLALVRTVVDFTYLDIIDVAQGGELLHRIDLDEESREQRPLHVSCLAFHPDGNVFAEGSRGKVRFWSAEFGRLVHTLSPSDAVVTAVCFSRTGELLATGDATGIIRFWGAQGAELARHEDAPTSSETGDEKSSILHTERSWSDITGRYDLVATFAAFDGKTVTLKRRNGTTAEVPIEKLSEADQTFVRKHAEISYDQSKH
jgi:WD40 repeat protein